MARDLIDLFEALALSACKIRAIVLTGSGQRAFCAGGDLKERNGMTDTASGQHLVYERMVRAVIGCPIPIIGAINGAAYGGGCELVAAVDFAYVSEPPNLLRLKSRLAYTRCRRHADLGPRCGGTARQRTDPDGSRL